MRGAHSGSRIGRGRFDTYAQLFHAGTTRAPVISLIDLQQRRACEPARTAWIYVLLFTAHIGSSRYDRSRLGVGERDASPWHSCVWGDDGRQRGRVGAVSGQPVAPNPRAPL